MGRRKESRQLTFDSTPNATAFSYLRNTASLGEARALLRRGLVSGGVECPCCQQFAKVYKRKLSSSMAYALILIYRYFSVARPDEYVHVPQLLNGHGVVARGGDWSKLGFWNMIEEHPDSRRDDGCKHTGEWRLTDYGRQFAAAVATAPKHLYFYNGQLIAKSSEATFIREALGNRFHYDELMSA
jgi:hypothetical protein